MKKTVLVLLDDYWHRRETIEPALPLLFPQDMWDMEVAQDPGALPARNPSPDLFVSFKDVIENDQIPTPIWCDDAWTAVLDRYIRTGVCEDAQIRAEIDRRHRLNKFKLEMCPAFPYPDGVVYNF